ncbi:MAG TPA: Stk1 family PASTA domain-containing Ser/Thr kinase [Gaiellaceae bacterium]
MTPPDPLIGALFDGRYKILKKLGSGGMATVYLAEDQELGRRIAIKILNARHASDKQFVERFRREASSAAGLSHPNIVQIYDRGNAEGTYYIAMEVIEGRSLKELVVQRGPSPIPVAINYTRQILAALRFAHRNGVVHRDIKPHNVLVDDEGRVKVTDFGIARAGASEMTEVGSIIGTAQYLSPEQARGAPVDDRSDLYSVGVLLYELLTGEAPYNGDTPVEIAMKHLSAVPEPPSAKRPEISPELDSVVLRALAKNPDDRYQSAAEMDADLSAISKGLEISEATTEAATTVLAGAGLSAPTMISKAPTRVAPPARPSAPVPPATPPDYYEGATVRRPIWPWLLALALAVAVGVAFWIVYRQLSENSPVPVPSVTGLTENAARKKITDAGLTVLSIRATSKTSGKGKVFDQRPAEGERIAPNSTVRIWVSSGTGEIRVKSVIGTDQYKANNELQGSGFKVALQSTYSDTAPIGTVYRQDPVGNDSALKGATVTIWVSKGPAPIALPSVVGKSYAEAASILKGRGFTNVVREDVSSDQIKDLVTAQDPPAYSSQAADTTITLSVSKGPQTVTVPPVEGFDLGSAESTITSYGLKYTAVYQDTSDPSQDGVVISQEPAGNSQAAAGSTVTLYVGNYVGAITP